MYIAFQKKTGAGKKMGVLFMMPNWAAPSEVWMQRMMEELGADLDTLVTWDTGGERKWHDHVKAVSLSSKLNRFGKYLSQIGIHAKFNSPDNILSRELRRKQITRILCHYGEFATTFMETWRKTNIPLFIHFHGYDATFDLRRYDEPHKRYFHEAYLQQICELSKRAAFIANSEFTKSLLEHAGIPINNTYVKYLGVPVSNNDKKYDEKKTINVLHVGRLVDFKSPDRTIKAFEIARSKGMNGQLMIAGDGPLRITCELLRSRSEYKDSIHLVGPVSTCQVQDLLADADIYTQHNIRGEITNQEECFGVSIIEAMAAGLPVVGTRSGAVIETVIDGETGILVEPGDIQGQADALLRFSGDSNLRAEIGKAGRKRVMTHFTVEHEAARLKSILGL